MSLKFPRALHVKSLHESTDVLAFGKSEEQKRDDIALGIGRVGGFGREPNYMYSYVIAAELLVAEAVRTSRLDDLSLPIFYLQRHATELLVKRLLWTAHSLATLRSKNDGVLAELKAVEARLNGKKNGHNIGLLLKDLCKLATGADLDEPPAVLGTLVADLAKVEMLPTWSRYERGTSGDRHMEQEHEVPVVAIMSRLKQSVASCEGKLEEGTYGRYLYEAWLPYARAEGIVG